jgi:hypothetical protein
VVVAAQAGVPLRTAQRWLAAYMAKGSDPSMDDDATRKDVTGWLAEAGLLLAAFGELQDA